MATMEDNSFLGKKSNDNPGIIWAPYIMTQGVSIISDNSEKIKNEVIQENRDRAIDSLLEDKEYQPMRIEDHPDYNGFSSKKVLKSRYSVINIIK